MLSKTFINVYTCTLFIKQFADVNVTAMDSMDEAGKSEK